MPQRDLHSHLKAVALIDPIVVNNDTEGTPAAGLDTRGFNSAELVAMIGQSGDTLSGSVYLTVVLEESDDDSTWTAVTDANDVLIGSAVAAVSAPDSNGIIATIDAASEDETHVRIGYTGTSRYVRLRIDTTGTHTNGTPCAVLGLLGNASGAPASD